MSSWPADALLKKEIKVAKASSWRNFTENASSVKDMARLVRSVTTTKTAPLGLVSQGDATARTPDEAVGLLISVFFPGCTEVGRAAAAPYRKAAIHSSECCGSFITAQKVKAAFDSFGADKAAGPDGFKPIVFQKVGAVTIDRITAIFRASLALGYIPARWCKSNVICLPKVGKADYSKVKSFRPISLSSFLLKGLERCIQWRVEETVLRARPFHSNQHAFRGGRSTDTALSQFCDTVEQAILRGQYCIGVFFDIEGAF